HGNGRRGRPHSRPPSARDQEPDAECDECDPGVDLDRHRDADQESAAPGRARAITAAPSTDTARRPSLCALLTMLTITIGLRPTNAAAAQLWVDRKTMRTAPNTAKASSSWKNSRPQTSELPHTAAPPAE